MKHITTITLAIIILTAGIATDTNAGVLNKDRQRTPVKNLAAAGKRALQRTTEAAKNITRNLIDTTREITQRVAEKTPVIKNIPAHRETRHNRINYADINYQVETPIQLIEKTPTRLSWAIIPAEQSCSLPASQNYPASRRAASYNY